MNQPQRNRTAGPGKSAGPAPGSQSTSGSQSIRKRSVTIAGHRTSVSLEEAFWDLLLGIANARGQSVSELVTEIDRQRGGNLSSAIRVFVLTEVAAGLDSEAPVT